MPRQSGSYTVREGQRYRAELTLGGFEALASNTAIARKLSGYGFTDVKVTGSGRSRIATARWSRPDATATLPKQVASVIPM